MGKKTNDRPPVFGGFHASEVRAAIERKAPAERIKAPERVRPGDVWRIGGGRLRCGDSSEAEAVLSVVPEARAALVLLDPPYGKGKGSAGVANDKAGRYLRKFYAGWIDTARACVGRVGSMFVWGDPEPLMGLYADYFRADCYDQAWRFKNLITWDKLTGAGILSDTMRSFSPCAEYALFLTKGREEPDMSKAAFLEEFAGVLEYLRAERDAAGLTGPQIVKACGSFMAARHCFTRSQWSMISERDYLTLRDATGGRHFTRPYAELFAEYERGRVILDQRTAAFYESRAFFDNTGEVMRATWPHTQLESGDPERRECGGHPTVKPAAIYERIIKTTTRPGDAVVDLFAGSGVTGIVCEYTGRSPYLFELSPRWCDVILARYIHHFGADAVELIEREAADDDRETD